MTPRHKIFNCVNLIPLFLWLFCIYPSLVFGSAKMVTGTGAQIESVTLDIGETYNDRVISKKFYMTYSFVGSDHGTNLAMEPLPCLVGRHRLTKSSATFGGKTMFQPQDVVGDGFSLELILDIPREMQGAIDCDGFELRDLSNGRAVAVFRINGFLRNVPKWESVGGGRLTQVFFSFDQMVARKSSKFPLDSYPLQVRLVDAAVYPAAALYQAPAECKIGSVDIPAKSLVLIANHEEISDSSIWNIGSSAVSNLKIRILASAGMGDKSGHIVCNRSGSLTYTF